MRIIESGAGVAHAVELKAIIEAERAGLPILVARDGEDRQRVFVLEPQDERLWVGRGPACDVRIEWDEKASRSHAELVRIPGAGRSSTTGSRATARSSAASASPAAPRL